MNTGPTPSKPSLFKQQPLNVIAIILAIIAIVFAALAWQQYGTLHHAVSTHSTQLQQSVTQLKTDFDQYQQQSQMAISETQKNLTTLNNQLSDTSTLPILTEVSYLIRTADLQLSMQNNVAEAIQLLKMAAQRLQPLTQPTVQGLKDAVNHDVDALSAIPQINVSDLIDQIDEISKQVSKLELQSPTAITTNNPTAPVPAASSWWDKIKNNLGGLKNLFIVNHVDDAAILPPNPQQFILLKENIRLKLSQAQWALICSQKKVYQQSLHMVAQWLTQVGQSQPDISEVVKKLEALAIIDIKPSTPALQSVQALSALPAAVKAQGSQP